MNCTSIRLFTSVCCSLIVNKLVSIVDETGFNTNQDDGNIELRITSFQMTIVHNKIYGRATHEQSKPNGFSLPITNCVRHTVKTIAKNSLNTVVTRWQRYAVER